MGKARGAPGARGRKMLALVCINASNMACHSVYSVLASFFPQAAHAKGLTAEPIGLVFAIFAAVVFVSAPLAAPMLSQHGKRQIYVAGLATVSSATIAFAFADHIDNPTAYLWWCILLRCVQGFGSALEETAAYALIADIDPSAISFNLGVTEVSTGLGYMVGPAIGGFLFAQGGFALPFLLIGASLLPAILLVRAVVRDDRASMRVGDTAPDGAAADGADDDEGEPPAVPLLALVAQPQIAAAVAAAVLGNVDYAFLEPTLAGHVEEVASSPQAIGLLFSVISLTYTLSSPLVGWLSHRRRLGPRNVVIGGLCLGAVSFLIVGPSPLLGPLLGAELGAQHVSLRWLCFALVLFGLAEGMSMTPLLEDMMLSCSHMGKGAINSLSALMTSAFSLGQMIGPLLGAFLSPRLGFRWATTLVSAALLLLALTMAVLRHHSRAHRRFYCEFGACPGARRARRTKGARKGGAHATTELAGLTQTTDGHPRRPAARDDSESEDESDSGSDGDSDERVDATDETEAYARAKADERTRRPERREARASEDRGGPTPGQPRTPADVARPASAEWTVCA
ncbi:hypothetical protein KFE25_010968 [Diacronema lutheri]|uniref:Major facilitator superfamily (MFS) profile domain-containing protein n=3 Tax=Diacronema lutheri TaxID=2081491 RepID=A0A8J5XFR1_DIALT|nr:hypothetical protein KFE25_010968 [Diacronema lutheri]